MERLTALEAYDLFSFREGEAPLRQALAHSGLGHEAVGIVLEYQIMLLNAVSHKEEAASAIKVLLKELKDVYGTNADVPIRRARLVASWIPPSHSLMLLTESCSEPWRWHIPWTRQVLHPVQW